MDVAHDIERPAFLENSPRCCRADKLRAASALPASAENRWRPPEDHARALPTTPLINTDKDNMRVAVAALWDEALHAQNGSLPAAAFMVIGRRDARAPASNFSANARPIPWRQNDFAT